MPLLLNVDHEKFAQSYASSGHIIEAAREVGLVDQIPRARALLRNPKIQDRIEEIVSQRFSKANITAERTLKELARIAFADVRDLYDPATGELRAVPELDDDTAATISQIKVEVVGQGRGAQRVAVVTKQLKQADKMAALSLLAKHFKIVGEDDDGVNALANLLAGRLKSARARAAEDIEDVDVVHRAEATLPPPGTRLEYAVPLDLSKADDLGPRPVRLVQPDPEALHSPYMDVEIGDDLS